MSNPFVAEIRIFPFNFAPKGWAFCDGQLLTISQNTALFSLLGTFYGGDAKVTFALPNLQGSAAMHTTQYSGNSPFGEFSLGQTGGEQYVTLLTSEMPSHTHTARADAATPQRDVHDAQQLRARLEHGDQYVLEQCDAAVGPDESRHDQRRGRQPAAQQHDAVSHAELLHRPSGRLPAAYVERGRIRWEPRLCPRSGSCRSTSRPKGWALCNGQTLPINQNQPLFALLGTTYGGNGQTTFALPNLQGRTARTHG